MRAVVAAAVAIFALGGATGAFADGDDGGGAPPAAASDSAGPADGWGVASSAGLTYAEPAGLADATLQDAAANSQTVSQNYQFLDSNVVEFTQTVAGETVTTLSGIMLQREGDDSSDAATLDEEASGVYSSGSAGLVPSIYGDGALQETVNGYAVSCNTGCALLGAEGGATGGGGGASGAVKTLASYASEALSSFTSYDTGGWGPVASGFPVPTPGSALGPIILPPPVYTPPSSNPPPPNQGGQGGDPPPVTPPGGGQTGGSGSNGAGGLPTAVPEPGAWILMLAGIGGIGGLARRRTRRSRPA